MPTRIYLVRHGANDVTAEDRFAGSTDVPLLEEERRQVTALAERLSGDTLNGIYASSLGRTMETARIIAGPHRCVPRSEPDLREIDYDRWKGHRRDDIEREYAEEYDAWQEDPLTVAPACGEPGLQVLARATPLIRNVIHEYRHRQVLVVSHKQTNRLFVSSLLGFDVRDF